MLAFKGSHGTSLSKARSIKTHGFDLKPGRIGSGAYFWASMSEEHLALSRDFAREWAAKRAREGRFRYDHYPKVTIVEADIEVEEDQIFYMDDPDYHLDLRLRLSEIVEAHFKVDSAFEVSRDDVRGIQKLLNGAIEEFIQMYERAAGKKMKIVFKCQTAPVKDPLQEYIGLSSCFSVRDTSCITKMHLI